MSHLGSLGDGTPEVTFESLLGHFNSFCAPVELGGRPLHKIRGASFPKPGLQCQQAKCEEVQVGDRGRGLMADG